MLNRLNCAIISHKFAIMYFTSHDLMNKQTGEPDKYFRLMRNFRDVNNKVRHSTVLSIGFLPKELTRDDLGEIAECINNRYLHKPALFEPSNERVRYWLEEIWQRIIDGKKLDIDLYNPYSQHIVTNSLYHEDVREVGAEWLAFNVWKSLKLEETLRGCGFTEEQIKLTATQIISRAVYPVSELATSKIVKDNSAICELTGYPIDKVNKDALYRNALRLYQCKDELERKLSCRTTEIFNHQDSIILFDLTNSYFELRPDKVGLELFQCWKT